MKKPIPLPLTDVHRVQPARLAATGDSGTYRTVAAGSEILVPASVRIAKEKAAAKLQAVRERAAARKQARAAQEERAIAKAALKIAKTLDRLAAQKEREATALERKAQRLAFQLARKDRLQEQKLAVRSRKKAAARKHKR
jgi:hypothetical protein